MMWEAIVRANASPAAGSADDLDRIDTISVGQAGRGSRNHRQRVTPREETEADLPCPRLGPPDLGREAGCAEQQPGINGYGSERWGRGNEVGGNAMRKAVGPIVVLASLVLVAMPSAAIIQDPETDTSQRLADDTFVTRSGTRLLLEGRPYRFTGLNIYNANSIDNCWYTLGTGGSGLGTSLLQMGPGVEAYRAWFFQYQATSNGERDWSAFDHALEVAANRGFRVVATLVNQWGQCEGWGDYAAGYKTESWYRTGYKTLPSSPGMPATYRDWVAKVVKRYRDHPAILSWQLVNEAEAKTVVRRLVLEHRARDPPGVHGGHGVTREVDRLEPPAQSGHDRIRTVRGHGRRLQEAAQRAGHRPLRVPRLSARCATG